MPVWISASGSEGFWLGQAESDVLNVEKKIKVHCLVSTLMLKSKLKLMGPHGHCTCVQVASFKRGNKGLV